MAAFHSMSDEISEENHRSMGPVLRQLHADTPEDSIAHDLIKFRATEHGQMQAMAVLSSASGSLLGSLAQVVNNELAPSVRGILSSNPHEIPDPGTIAQLASRDLVQHGDAIASIAQQGIDGGWASALIKMNETFPDSGTMLDLVRRGTIGRDTFIQWSVRSGMAVSTAEAVLAQLNVPLSPADAALAVLRGNMSQGQGDKVAAENGLTAEQFQTLVDNTGEPLGLMELLEAHRRGFIDDARLTRGIIQSRV